MCGLAAGRIIDERLQTRLQIQLKLLVQHYLFQQGNPQPLHQAKQHQTAFLFILVVDAEG